MEKIDRRTTWAPRALRAATAFAALACAAALAACGSGSGGGSDGGSDGGPDGGSDGGAKGYLWYAGTALCAFEESQTGASATVMPAILVTSPPISAFSDVALDRDGNVWAVGVGADQVARFSAATLGASGNITPDLVIRSAALQSPGNLAFDRDGNLWVANRGPASPLPDDGTIVRFDQPQGLSGTQDLTPSLQIRSAASGDLFRLGAIAFDASGNLWATSYAGIVRFNDAVSLNGNVTRNADLVIWNLGYLPDSVYFYTIAFDASGALWAAAQTAGFNLTSVLKFANPGLLSGTLSPAPAVTITGEKDLLPAGGLAFDRDGHLWLARADAILQYSNPGQLSGSVNPAPAVTLGVFNEASPALNARLVFFPIPAGLPIY